MSLAVRIGVLMLAVWLAACHEQDFTDITYRNETQDRVFVTVNAEPQFELEPGEEKTISYLHEGVDDPRFHIRAVGSDRGVLFDETLSGADLDARNNEILVRD